MSAGSRDEFVATFQSSYGRLCVLVARALRQGRSREHVLEASRGRGSQPAPVYMQIRVQRRFVYSALDACKSASVPWADIRRAARTSKRAVEGEWMLKIPMFSEAS